VPGLVLGVSDAAANEIVASFCQAARSRGLTGLLRASVVSIGSGVVVAATRADETTGAEVTATLASRTVQDAVRDVPQLVERVGMAEVAPPVALPAPPALPPALPERRLSLSTSDVFVTIEAPSSVELQRLETDGHWRGMRGGDLASAFELRARADDKPAPPQEPAVHHAPVIMARVGEELSIGAAVDRPDRAKRVLLVVRGAEGAREIEFQRSSDATRPYVAVVPGSAVRSPALSYAIEVETIDGARVPAFATRAEPHTVSVVDSPEDAREAAELRRLGGRRSVIEASGEFVSFGRSSAVVTVPGTAGQPARKESRSVSDRYYRTEATYTYRLLGVVSEFGIRAGIVRGSSLVENEPDPASYDVGLNYGAPRVRVRLADWIHVDGEFLTSVTEVGFSVGGGGALVLGDPYGAKLVFGGEGIQVFGARAYSRLDIIASTRLRFAPIVEVTSMPHADRAGLRLLGEAGVELGAGFHLDLRSGYQARSFDQGGPTIGGGLAYAF
jgi:hypothetical protein